MKVCLCVRFFVFGFVLVWCLVICLGFLFFFFVFCLFVCFRWMC